LSDDATLILNEARVRVAVQRFSRLTREQNQDDLPEDLMLFVVISPGERKSEEGRVAR